MTTPLITAHPDAPVGIVRRLSSYSASDFPPGSAILCRNTAPLIGFAYALLRRSVPCRILGRDIGAQLVALVKRLRPINLDDLSLKLASWVDRETAKAIGEDRSPERITDQAECLRFFMSSVAPEASITSLISKIESMFTDMTEDSSARVTLSTVHKAKGMEYPTVFILDKPKLMPSRFATQPWEKEQERNLIYTAITRAKEALYYIDSDNWKEE